jgi:hypothetical protein
VENIWFLAVIVGVIAFVVWDQITMYERVKKRYNAARARNEPFVFTDDSGSGD